MKVLKMIGLVFAKIALVITVILFMASLSASYVLENGISSLLISGLPNVGESVQRREVVNAEQVSEIDLSEIYNQVLNEFGITEEQLMTILESDVAKELISEFADTVLEDISTGDTSDFDLGEKVLDFVQDNQSEIESVIGQPLPMDKIEEFAKSEEVSQFNDQYKGVITTVSGNVPAPLKGVINFIENFISEDFREVCLIVSLVLVVIIALLQWSFYKWIRTLGNTILGVSIFMFIVSILGNLFSSALTAMLNFSGSLGFGKSMMISAISGGLGIILLIIYMIVKKIFGKEVDNTEISQNAN